MTRACLWFLLLLLTADRDLLAQEARPVALVELFTSQGCSSCPRADQLLSRLVAAGDSNIIALSFHVDYWDRLGWKDPFSASEYTLRQRQYAKTFGSSSIYTPQMIVNGSANFVGSDEAKAKAAIARALKRDSDPIGLTVKGIEQNEIAITYHISDQLPDSRVLHLAVVERNITTQVKRGENGGRTLRHDNVVRALETLKYPNAQNTARIAIPDGVKWEDASLVAFVQDTQTMKIERASQRPLVK